MHLGLTMFATEDSAQPAELARMAEERGFESLFFPEHTHIPTSRETPYPLGGELPREYSRTYDPLVALTAAGAVTERLRLGTGICLLVERDPIVTAKAVATLDRLSRGRVLFGVGAGWNLEEMRDHGTDPASRFALLGERVEAVRAIWTREVAEYHGRHVDFGPMWAWPKPVQAPHPPILVGGNGPRVLDRVLAYGDEWMPNAIGDEERLRARIAELRARARDAGRAEPGVTIYGLRAKADVIERYAAAGVTRGLLLLPAVPASELEPRLDHYAGLVARAAGTPGSG